MFSGLEYLPKPHPGRIGSGFEPFELDATFRIWVSLFPVFSKWRKGEAGSIQGNMVADNLGPIWILLTWIWTRTSNTQNLRGGQSAKKSENRKNGRFFGAKLKKKIWSHHGTDFKLRWWIEDTLPIPAVYVPWTVFAIGKNFRGNKKKKILGKLKIVKKID